MTDAFDPRELIAADRLDLAVDEARAGGVVGGPGAAVVRTLVAELGAHPPAGLAARVTGDLARARARIWLPARAAALVLAVLLALHASGNLFNGRWIARHVHGAYDPHSYREAAIGLLALAVIALAAARRPRLLGALAAGGLPFGLAFLALGFHEFSTFHQGGLLHLGEGGAGIAVAVLWRLARRYGDDPRSEGSV
jgi:hypothetical protein